MSLQDQLRPASFRGVPFGVISTEASGLARRIELHEYPRRDSAFAEDLGAQTGTFEVEAFVAWPFRDALIEACRRAGPGPLVHPLLGTHTVVCTGCDVSESTQSAGVSRFALAFTEAGTNVFPVEQPNSQGQLGSAVTDARGVLQGSFLTRFAARTAPQWVTDLAIGWTNSVSAALKQASQIVPGATDLASFNVTRLALGTNAEGLIADNTLGVAISDGVRLLAGLGSANPLAALRMLETLGTFGDLFDVFTPSTPARAGANDRREAIVRMVRRSAAVEASALAAEVPLDSYDAAVLLRERLVAMLDPELDFAGDSLEDDAHAALSAVLAAVVRDLRDRGAQLARVRTLVLASTTPAAVLAYRLYKDIERDAELVARNKLRHPLFVPAAVPLEVLSA